MSQMVAGFLWAVVTDNNDPKSAGGVRVKIRGLFEQGYKEWVYPVGWPGAGLPERGSYYTQPVGSQVIVMFEQGDIESQAVYLPGPYGAPDGIAAGPETVRKAARENFEGGNPRDLNIFWEDEYYRFYVVTKDGDRRMVMASKVMNLQDEPRVKIELNSTDGSSGKSATLKISADTSIEITSKGTVDITGTRVQIQERIVAAKPGVTTI